MNDKPQKPQPLFDRLRSFRTDKRTAFRFTVVVFAIVLFFYFYFYVVPEPLVKVLGSIQFFSESSVSFGTVVSMLGLRVFQLVFLVLFLTLAVCSGAFLLRRCKLFSEFDIMALVFSAGVGVILISHLTLLLGVLGLLRQWVFISVTAVMLAVCYRELILLLKYFRQFSPSVYVRESTPLSRLLTAFVLLLCIVNLIGSYMPQVDFDTLEYHLGALREYIREGKVVRLDHNVYSNFPFGVEMIYLYGLTTFKIIPPAHYHFLLGFLAAIAVYAFGKRYLTRGAGLIAAVVFYMSPLVAEQSFKASVDLGLTFFTTVSILAFLTYIKEKKKGFLILSGVFCGAAVSAKYTALLLLFLPLVAGVLIFELTQGDNGKRRFKRVVATVVTVIVVVFLIFSPWMVKNIVYKHNPVFPLLYDFLGGKDWTARQHEMFMEHHAPANRSISRMFTYIWDISVMSLVKSVTFSFLVLFPLIIFLRKYRRELLYMVLFLAAYFLLWFLFTHQFLRFLMPIFPISALVCGYAASESLDTSSGKKLLAAVLTTVFIVVVPTNLLIITSTAVDSQTTTGSYAFSYLIGQIGRDEHLSHNVPFHRAVAFMNEELPEGSKVLFLGELRTYYADFDLIAPTPFDKNIFLDKVRISADAADLRRNLLRSGIDYIFLNESEFKRLKKQYGYMTGLEQRQKQMLNEFFSQEVEVIFADEDCLLYVYKLRSAAELLDDG